MAFWYGWNSWVVELLGGGALALAMLFVTWGHVPAATFFAASVSLYYEFALDARRRDPTHSPWADIGQRAVGSTIVLLIAAIL